MFTANKEKGASAVELAIVSPLLFLVLLGIIEFGFIMYDKAVITNASREGARKGIVFHQPGSKSWDQVLADVVRAANNYGTSHLVSFGDGSIVPSVSVDGNCFTSGSALTVRVTYPYKFLVLPNLAGTLPNPITLTGVTLMNCENQMDTTSSSPVAP